MEGSFTEVIKFLQIVTLCLTRCLSNLIDIVTFLGQNHQPLTESSPASACSNSVVIDSKPRLLMKNSPHLTHLPLVYAIIDK